MRGAGASVDENWPEPTSVEHPYTLMYTSGTTGDPKGAIITHRNVLSMIACSAMTPSPPHTNDRVLSYLPLAHVAARGVVLCQMYYGGQVGIWSNNLKTFKDDLAACKPTGFVSVPRLYNKFYDAIQNALS